MITAVRPNPEHPTTDREISRSLPTVSSHGTETIAISVSETLPASLAPTSQDETGHTVPIAVTQPNGQGTTWLSTVEEGAASSHLPVISGPDNLESTHGSHPSTLSIPAISTVFTRPGGEVSTAVPPIETDSQPSKTNQNPNEQSSVESPNSKADSTRSTETNPATETVVPEPSSVSTTSTEQPSGSASLSTDNSTTTPITRDLGSPASTANSNGPDISTISPSAEHHSSSRVETSGSESDTDAATGPGITNTDPLTLPTSVPETQVNGVASAIPVKPTTPLGEHSTRGDDVPSTEPGHITTSDSDDEQASSTSPYFVVPVTTSVTKPEPRDDGFVVPCNMWFFDACVGPISGWGISLPPGTYPPGPPPAISDNPKGGIEINTNQPIPNWPGFTVGPGNTPTFSGEPTACETDSAELCVTSTSYAVSIDATVTATVSSGVVSTCGTVYGCKVRSHSQTMTGTDVTTATSGIPTYRSLRAIETWDDMELSKEQLESIANHVQSDLDSMFGTATKRATTTTGDASEPTKSVWTGTCPAKNGPDPTVVDGKFTENIGEKCLCEWNTWMKSDKTLQPHTLDQLRDAIKGFCNGSRKLRKPAPTGLPDVAVNRFPTDGTHGIFISAGWATPPLWNSTDERCKVRSDLLLADSYHNRASVSGALFQLAVHHVWMDIIKLAISADNRLLYWVDPNSGNTALHIVIESAHVDVIKTLLEAGADPNLKNGDGLLPFMKAMRSYGLDIVKTLLDSSTVLIVNEPDKAGVTPFLRACLDGKKAVPVIRELLEKARDKVNLTS
ncbi:hypothetical protein FDENT_10823 [Fusarium denticulatum]|uniref:Ankyrin n=1 Tax=Fusarium denticulatum TaxID=48507 RepID=A0A8H5TNH8_9HYPO|nr:hypothetical protein FDENT_10823 [Fusarium denticulatum]